MKRLTIPLYALAALMLLALLIAPQTRWLVRLQTLISVGLYHLIPGESNSYTLSPEEDERRIKAVAARYPDDYQIQYAAADGKTNGEILVSLRALKTRFPDKSALDANILRYETMGNIHLVRSESNLLLGEKNDPRAFFRLPTPQHLAVFDQEAAAGERQDPNNAYFPLMRAVGLFAAHQDAAGVEAVRRAGRKPVWQEYTSDDVENRWRLHQEAFGDAGALPRAATLSATMLPQYVGLNQAAQVVTYQAMRSEQAGHPQTGLELREAVRHCGDLMRVQSSFLITSAIGVRICSTSCLRPGGAPPEKNDKGVTARYAAYARRLGREDIARKAEAEYAADQPISALMQRSETIYGDYEKTVTVLDHWWVADLLTLGNIFWTLILGAAAVLPARAKRSQGRLATLKQIAEIFSLLFLLLFLLLLLLTLALNLNDLIRRWPDWLAYGGELLLLAALALGIRQIVLRVDWRRIKSLGAWRILGVILLTLLGLYGFYAFVSWQAHGVWQTSAAPIYLQNDPGSEANQLAIQQAQWWSFGGVIAVPLLLIAVLGIAARVRRVSTFTGVVQGFQAAILPAICLLMLVYSVLLIGTVRQEHIVNEQTKHVLHDEGRSLIAHKGQAWPGPVL